jgi:DNA-binding response OmpR family regulator
MVTARNDTHDVVAGLEAGADDYLTKPFGKAELLARIAAVMRRADRMTGPAAAAGDGDASSSALALGSLTLDLGRHEARVGEVRLDLTPIEFRIAEALVRAAGDLVPHLRLVRAGWPAEADPDLLWLKPHVARLRRKLQAVGGPEIVALRGVGYRLEPG